MDGKVVVVAGGAGGIGTATSTRLAAEGASVVVGDIDLAAAQAVVEAITASGGTARAAQVDIADDASVSALLDVAEATYGGIDALHANAADLSPATIGCDLDATTVDLDVFDRTIAVNLRGYLLCTRQVIPRLLARGGGAVVYTSSGAAFVGEPERVSYAVAKSGVNALMRHVASRWGKEGVRANAVAPGLVLNEQVQASLPEAFRSSVLRATRSPRLGLPDDVAGMVAFLVSDDGQWINGQVFSVDGGVTLR